MEFILLSNNPFAFGRPYVFSDQGTLICSETSKKLYIVFIVLKDVLAVNATNKSESSDLSEFCYHGIQFGSLVPTSFG